jgi:hypothetical protein
MTRIRHGDVFAVPLPNGLFIFGRVMLNVARCVKQRLIPEGSPLGGFNRECLVQMYQHLSPLPEYVPSPVLIPGAYVWPDELGTGWPIVAHGHVDCRMVEFPECLSGFNHEEGETAFIAGEIFIPIPISNGEYIDLDVQYTVFPPVTWGYNCLHMLGREDIIPEKWRRGLGLADSDLRYSPHRDRIYQYLPFDKDLSYWEKQEQLGHSLERFYAF